ncbi:MAG: hypothetical protein H7222_14100 [Methylotenera sp.]|nr:hypothetical protein [Oligoflexia bacterium]
MPRFKVAFKSVHSLFSLGLIAGLSLTQALSTDASAGQDLRFIAGPNVSKTLIAERRQLLNSVSERVIAPYLLLPPSITVTVPATLDASFCMNETLTHFEITVPAQMSIKGAKPKNPVLTDTVLEHEYGHAVLQYNLMQSSAFRSAFPKYMKGYQVRALLFPLQDQRAALEEQIRMLNTKPDATPADLAQMQAIQNKVDHLDAKLDALADQFKPYADEFQTIENMLGDYHEFFADIVSVIYSQNPKVLWQALYTPQYKSLLRDDKKKLAELLQGFTLRRFDKGLRVETYSQTEIHVSLSPTRAYLWKYYISNPLYKHRESRFLKTLQETILQEVTERSRQRDLIDLDPEVLNKRFMAKIDQNFPKIAQPIIGGH